MAYTNFIWTFEKRLEYADGVSEIVYSVKAADQGYPTLNFKDYQVKGESGWVLTQTPAGGTIKGTVKSTQSNKGTLQILYKGIPIGKNEDEIAFNEFDIAISSSGNGADLAEDRMPGGKGAAPSPNEIDPGSVIISGTSGGIRSKLTLRGKAKEGSYQLTGSNPSGFALYDAAEGGNAIALPQTLSATELGNKTYYVGSVGNAKESSTGMLTLTYQIPLKTSEAVYKLEDKVSIIQRSEPIEGKIIAVDLKNPLRKANPDQKLVLVKYGGNGRQALISALPDAPKDGYPIWYGEGLVNPQKGALDVKFDSQKDAVLSCQFSPNGRQIEKYIDIIEENKIK
jgi:hypothetical protein